MPTTQPGGLYKNASGQLVDANGKPAKRQVDGPEFDVENANKPDLIAEAGRRGLEVKRADGDESKEPTADDFRAALK